MSLTARVFRYGTGDVDQIRLVAGSLADVPDRDLAWVDFDGRAGGVDQVAEAIGDRRVLDAAAASTITSVRFLEGGISLALQAMRVLDQERGAIVPRPVLVRFAVLPNVVVTLHEEPVMGTGDAVERVASDPGFGRLDAGSFLGLLLEGILNGYFEVTERIEREVDHLDDLGLRRQQGEHLLDDIVDIRRRISILRRALVPQRGVFAALTRPLDAVETRSTVGVPGPEVAASLGRAIDAVEHAREQLIGTFDIVMTRTAQRTNDVVRVLTVVSITLLPSVVIAGLMGMNFRLGFFDDPANFLVVVALMLVLAGGTLAVARARRWI